MKLYLSVTQKPRLKKPILICVWPGMGEVAYKLGAYLKDKLKMEEFASLEAPELFPPTGIWIQKNLIHLPKSGQGKFYFYKNKAGANDLILFISDAQPLLEYACGYCKKIAALSRELGVKKVFTFAAIPQTIDHAAVPEVWFAATSKKVIEEVENLKLGLKLLASGQVSGLNGLFLGIAKEMGLEGVCLLGEIPLFTLQIENPKSSLAILQKLKLILNLDIDTSILQEQVKLMEQEIDKLIEFIQNPEAHHPLGPGPIGEDEIERIKKSLSLQTKLPKSAREKVEKLFQEAKQNIAKAMELKKELDQWNAYKEYEDRFLDLFKKAKDKEEKQPN